MNDTNLLLMSDIEKFKALLTIERKKLEAIKKALERIVSSAECCLQCSIICEIARQALEGSSPTPEPVTVEELAQAIATMDSDYPIFKDSFYMNTATGLLSTFNITRKP